MYRIEVCLFRTSCPGGDACDTGICLVDPAGMVDLEAGLTFSMTGDVLLHAVIGILVLAHVHIVVYPELRLVSNCSR